MLVINCFGAPCSGKSTLAATIYEHYKKKGVNIEYLQEFAKQKIYEGIEKIGVCEPYLFGNQLYNQMILADGVDVIVTDCPLLLPHIYEENPLRQESLAQLELSYYKDFWNFDIFLERNHEYKQEGRPHTEKESDIISVKIKEMLDGLGLKYTTYRSGQSNQKLFNTIDKFIKEFK